MQNVQKFCLSSVSCLFFTYLFLLVFGAVYVLSTWRHFVFLFKRPVTVIVIVLALSLAHLIFVHKYAAKSCTAKKMHQKGNKREERLKISTIKFNRRNF